MTDPRGRPWGFDGVRPEVLAEVSQSSAERSRAEPAATFGGMPSVHISVAVGKGFSRLTRRGLLSKLVEGLRLVAGSERATPDVMIVGNLDSGFLSSPP